MFSNCVKTHALLTTSELSGGERGVFQPSRITNPSPEQLTSQSVQCKAGVGIFRRSLKESACRRACEPVGYVHTAWRDQKTLFFLSSLFINCPFVYNPPITERYFSRPFFLVMNHFICCQKCDPGGRDKSGVNFRFHFDWWGFLPNSLNLKVMVKIKPMCDGNFSLKRLILRYGFQRRQSCAAVDRGVGRSSHERDHFRENIERPRLCHWTDRYVHLLALRALLPCGDYLQPKCFSTRQKAPRRSDVATPVCLARSRCSRKSSIMTYEAFHAIF